MKFHERLKQARKSAKLSQPQASELLEKEGYFIKQYAISSWETGKHKPDVEQLAALCRVYKADAGYLITGVKNQGSDQSLFGLNQRGRAHALKLLKLLKSDPLFTENYEPPKNSENKEIPSIRTYRLYDIPVSAGTGSYLDSDDYEEITGDDLIPRNTDFAVRVSGDSMEPKYHNGQIVFIKEQQTLNDGEIGIFDLNGEAYLKMLMKGALVSLNSKYKPIKLTEFDELRVFGKVVGAE